MTNPFFPVSHLLAYVVLDHRPLSLFINPIGNLWPLPFIFSATWIKDSGFFDIVRQAWNIFIQGYASFIWEHKLKSVKKGLKIWVVAHDFNPGKEKATLIRTLEGIQDQMEQVKVTKEMSLER